MKSWDEFWAGVVNIKDKEAVEKSFSDYRECEHGKLDCKECNPVDEECRKYNTCQHGMIGVDCPDCNPEGYDSEYPVHY